MIADSERLVVTAGTALGLFALASAAVSVVGYYLIARAWGLWPFKVIRADQNGPRPATPFDDDEIEGDEPPGLCGLVCEGGSERRGCGCQGPAQCPYRALVGHDPCDLWSGVDPRHGDDGNSGHG